MGKGNIAFKCNYNDGGRSKDSYGFDGVCSNAIIKYNIEKRKYEWCTNPACQCFRFYKKRINRDQLEAYYRENGSVCYESAMMTDWAAGAGINHHGAKAGEPRTIKNAEVGDIGVLTTVLPNMPEEDRRIFAVFRIGEVFEGGDETEGYVVADTKYRIALTPRETFDLKFWDYYSNQSDANKCRWSSGLFRYLEDKQVAQMLRQLARIKSGTHDSELAANLFESFCVSHGFENRAEIGNPDGARQNK